MEMKSKHLVVIYEGRKCLFNDALNTFYLRLYGVRHMVVLYEWKIYYLFIYLFTYLRISLSI